MKNKKKKEMKIKKWQKKYGRKMKESQKLKQN